MSTAHHYVVVTFTTNADNQDQALAEIGDYPSAVGYRLTREF